jgi:hypothetical protein
VIAGVFQVAISQMSSMQRLVIVVPDLSQDNNVNNDNKPIPQPFQAYGERDAL